MDRRGGQVDKHTEILNEALSDYYAPASMCPMSALLMIPVSLLVPKGDRAFAV